MSIKQASHILKQQKLKDLEQSLTKIMETLDKEINQTDVEWMHIKSLISSLAPKETIPTNEQKCVVVSDPNVELIKQPEKCNFALVKPEHQIDDLAVNELDLDLSMGILNHPSLEEESDSD